MTVQQQRYFYWLDQQRRRQSLYRAVRAKIANIARFIAQGGDPCSDPAYKDDYMYLIGEFGEGVFESEVNRLRLMREEDCNG